MRINRTYFLLAVFGLLAFTGEAQLDTVLVKTLGTGAFEEGVDMIYLQDSGLLVLGNIGGEGAGAGDFMLARFDRDNNRVWVNTYGSDFPERSSTVAELESGMYAVGGLSYALPPVYQAYVSLIDSNGVEIASQRIGTREGFSEVRAFVKLTSGEYYVLYNQWNAANESDRRVLAAHLSWNAQLELTIAIPQVIAGTEGFELIDFSYSLDSQLLAAGAQHGAGLDARFTKWNESFQEELTATFETAGNEQYNAIADHPELVLLVGYTDGYNEADRDIIIHKYTQDGILFDEEVRGHYDGGPSADDEALSAVFVSPTSFLMTGYTTTFGQNPGVTPDLFMSLVDTALYDIQGSTTLGEGQNDVGLKVLPWREGLIALGSTDSYGSGLSDVMVLQRDSFQGDIHVTEIIGLIDADSSYAILSVPIAPAQDGIVAYASEAFIHVESPRVPIHSIRGFDLLGKVLFEMRDTNRFTFNVPRNQISSQLILLTIEGDGLYESQLIFLP